MAINYLVKQGWKPQTAQDAAAEQAATTVAVTAALGAAEGIVTTLVNAAPGPVYLWELEKALRDDPATSCLTKVQRREAIQAVADTMHPDGVPPLVAADAQAIETE